MYYSMENILSERFALARQVAGIFDEEEVSSVDPISYVQVTSNGTYLTVYMFGNKKFYSVVMKVREGEFDDVTGALIDSYFDIFKFKNISKIAVDQLGCVITDNRGKKTQLGTNCCEGAEAFNYSARGLYALWDEYDS